MAYTINGTTLTLQPTSGRWIDRPILGFSGNGHPEYAGVREFELRWQLSSRSDANQLQGLYDALNVTGTAAVGLPKYRTSTWEFYTYSGCTLGEPSSAEFFEKHETEIILMVYGIVT